MKKIIEYDDIYFMPRNKGTGEYLFDEMPCATEQAFEIIGKKGVEIIHQKFAEMIEWGKKRFGENNLHKYGFQGIQKFADLRTNIVFLVGSTINAKINQKERAPIMGFQPGPLPNLIIPKEFKANDYKLLMSTPHYIIEPFRKYDENFDIKKHFSKGY